MFAYHVWHADRFNMERDEYTKRLRAAERRKHRSLPREKRLVADLLKVLDRLARAAKTTHREAERIGMNKFMARTERWMKQYNRLKKALDTLD